MSRETLPSHDESVEFFKRTAGAVMLLGDDLVHCGDPRTAGVGRILLALLFHGLNLALGQDRALAHLRHLANEVNQKRLQRRMLMH